MRGAVHDDVLTSRPVTIPEVRMSADLRLATVYVTAAGQDTDDVIAALNRAKKFIRGEVARAINLKFAPDVRFLVDETLDEATRIEQVLRSPHVAQDLKKS